MAMVPLKLCGQVTLASGRWQLLELQLY